MDICREKDFELYWSRATIEGYKDGEIIIIVPITL